MKWRWRGVGGALALVLALGTVPTARAQAPRVALPPSPYAILGSDLLDPPPLDAIPVCIPARLSLQLGDFESAIGEGDFETANKQLRRYEDTISIDDPVQRRRDIALLRAALAARSATVRDERLSAYAQLEAITRRDEKDDRRMCGLIESARLLFELGRLPEADAAVHRITQKQGWLGDDHPNVQAARFYQAEILYERGDAFNAHLKFRELASSGNPRLAAAARLRLTDLSFDAGKSRSVQLEYETLLPHGSAFGARMVDWALRGSEAALDAGDLETARSWFDLHGEQIDDRDARDVVEIRRADLDALRGKPEEAFERLRALWRRKGRADIEVLARVRGIDLGVSSEPADVRIERLHDATSSANRRVRIYALSVLVHELRMLGRLDEGIAAVTRLAYEGADLVLARNFPDDLAALLDRIEDEVRGESGCQRLIRRLGGRYGLLLDHAADLDPFLSLGRCFERMQFYDLAVSLYRSLARSFGASAADAVALPLARTSLEAGDAALARAAAEVNLRAGTQEQGVWRALLARAEAALGHDDRARALVRSQLENDPIPDQRIALALLFAELLDGRPYDEDTALLIRTLDETPQAQRESGSRDFAQASMLAAQMLRRQARPTTAKRLYEMASAWLPEGSRQEEARYWAGRATGPGAPQAGDGKDLGVGGPWPQLARYDERASAMRDAHELGEAR